MICWKTQRPRSEPNKETHLKTQNSFEVAIRRITLRRKMARTTNSAQRRTLSHSSSTREGSSREQRSNNKEDGDALQIDNVSISRKTKFRYVLARCDNYEKQLADLLQALSLYTRRTAKLRDSGDTISDAFSALASGEAVNPGFKRSTIEMAKSMRSIQDHRDSEVLYFEEKLLASLAHYGEVLQKQKEKIRSAVPKVADDRNRGSIWTSQAASGQRRQRSQSADRTERISKDERDLQRQVQQYEFHKNLVLKKLILRFLLAELRLTIKSFNNLTATYQNVLQDFSPHQDLKAFNEFFNFRAIKKSILNEIQDDVSDFESPNDEDDEDDDEEGDDDEDERESGLDDVHSVDDVTEAPDDEDNSESWRSESGSTSVQSTLRRFNSTPEIVDNSNTSSGTGNGSKLNKPRKETLPPLSKHNSLLKTSMSQQKLGSSSTSSQSKSINSNRRASIRSKHPEEAEEGDDDEEDEEDDDDEEEEAVRNKKSTKNNKNILKQRPTSVRSIRRTLG